MKIDTGGLAWTQTERTSDGKQTQQTPTPNQSWPSPLISISMVCSHQHRGCCGAMTPSELTIGAHWFCPCLNPWPTLYNRPTFLSTNSETIVATQPGTWENVGVEWSSGRHDWREEMWERMQSGEQRGGQREMKHWCVGNSYERVRCWCGTHGNWSRGEENTRAPQRERVLGEDGGRERERKQH